MKIKKFENFTDSSYFKQASHINAKMLVSDKLEDEIKSLSFILEDHETKVKVQFVPPSESEHTDCKIIIDIESIKHKRETHGITLWKEICRLKDPIIEYIERVSDILRDIKHNYKEFIQIKIVVNLNSRIHFLEIYYDGGPNSPTITDMYARKCINSLNKSMEDWSPEQNLENQIQVRTFRTLKASMFIRDK